MGYKCVKSFRIATVDDDGALTDDYMTVRKNTVWSKDDSKYRMAGDADSIRLVHKNNSWLELQPDTLSQHFVLV